MTNDLFTFSSVTLAEWWKSATANGAKGALSEELQTKLFENIALEPIYGSNGAEKFYEQTEMIRLLSPVRAPRIALGVEGSFDLDWIKSNSLSELDCLVFNRVKCFPDEEASKVEDSLKSLVRDKKLILEHFTEPPSKYKKLARHSLRFSPHLRLSNGQWLLRSVDLQEVQKGDRLTIEGRAISETGAGAVTELASIASASAELMTSLGNSRECVFEVTLGLGTDFFTEIAKLRALRILWAEVADLNRFSSLCFDLMVESASWARGVADPHSNILRSTLHSLVASLGRADGIQIRPYDEGATRESLSNLLSITTPLITHYEGNLNAVHDLMGGSWFLEQLTYELVEAAWKLFHKVQGEGGLNASLREGILRKRINQESVARAEQFKKGAAIMIGENKYLLHGSYGSEYHLFEAATPAELPLLTLSPRVK